MEGKKPRNGKSPWRFFFAACALIGGGGLLGQWLLKLWLFRELTVDVVPTGIAGDAASIGIIGGADGPTAIFITGTIQPWMYELGMALLLAVGIFGYVLLRKTKKVA